MSEPKVVAEPQGYVRCIDMGHLYLLLDESAMARR